MEDKSIISTNRQKALETMRADPRIVVDSPSKKAVENIRAEASKFDNPNHFYAKLLFADTGTR